MQNNSQEIFTLSEAADKLEQEGLDDIAAELRMAAIQTLPQQENAMSPTELIKKYPMLANPYVKEMFEAGVDETISAVIPILQEAEADALALLQECIQPNATETLINLRSLCNSAQYFMELRERQKRLKE